MNSSQDSDRKYASDMAWEGARLLGDRDYEGAVEACTMAIESDPSWSSAYLTRAEAYQQLGRKEEADADLLQTHRSDADADDDRVGDAEYISLFASYFEFLRSEG